jgi:lipopolysaccharide heptosyltransferase II
LTNRIPLDYSKHQAEFMLSCLEPLGIKGGSPRLKIYLPKTISSEDLEHYSNLRKPGRLLIGISINDGLQGRRWREDRWRGLLALMVADERLSIVVFSAPAQKERIVGMLSEFVAGPTVCYEVPVDLAHLVHLVSVLDMLISVDSGPVHISAGLAIPTIAIFGAQPPSIWGPFQKASRVLRKVQGHVCVDASFGNDAFINAITPEEVYAACINITCGFGSYARKSVKAQESRAFRI